LEVRGVSLFNLNCIGDGGASLASFQIQNHANVELRNPCTFLFSSVAFCVASASVSSVYIPGILSALNSPKPLAMEFKGGNETPGWKLEWDAISNAVWESLQVS
jgi:hypothetical protein